MKNKIFVIGFLAAALALAGNASAEQNGEMKATAQGQELRIQNNEQMQNEDTTAQPRENGQQPSRNEDATGNTNQNQEEERNQEKNQNQEQEGELSAEQHRSAVANFVQKLLDVADREGGIGEQVRTIAQEQNQAVDTTVQAMEKVQKRNNIATFLFGSDYKNLGTLRSEAIQTSNRLEKLNELLQNTIIEADKTELQNQIQTLETEQTKIENFIKEQEDKFSLFGWLVKMFNQ